MFTLACNIWLEAAPEDADGTSEPIQKTHFVLILKQPQSIHLSIQSACSCEDLGLAVAAATHAVLLWLLMLL